MTRQDAIAELNRWKDILQPFMDCKCRLKFGRFDFPVVIHAVRLAPTTKMKNPPAKRKTESGKNYTPTVFEIVTDVGIMRILPEDRKLLVKTNSVLFCAEGDIMEICYE